MKRYIKSAQDFPTIFYRVTIDQAKEAIEDSDLNIFLKAAFDYYEWQCLDIEHGLHGSEVNNNILYLCDTNGDDILVDGREVDPISALDYYDIDELANYVKDATPNIIVDFLNEDTITEFDVDVIGTKLIEDGTPFTVAVEAYNEL